MISSWWLLSSPSQLKGSCCTHISSPVAIAAPYPPSISCFWGSLGPSGNKLSGSSRKPVLEREKKTHQTAGARSKKAAYTCKSGSLYSVVCVHTLFQEPSPLGCHHSQLFAVCARWRAWNIATKMCILVNRYSLGWLLAEHKALLIESGIWQGCVMIHFGC